MIVSVIQVMERVDMVGGERVVRDTSTRPISINPDHIIFVLPDKYNPRYSTLHMTEGHYLTVEGDSREVRANINTQLQELAI